ncbi:hypothetical protein HG531_006328 [Fusarium graminearum]|nr:hypothetical protein HG531_006328 [Fusarium graminearum]
MLTREDHRLRLHSLALDQNSRLPQDVDGILHHLGANSLCLCWEPDRLEPLPRIRLCVAKTARDVRHRLLLILVEVLNALVQLAKQILYATIQTILCQFCRGDNLPAAPGCVDFTDAADLTRVVELLGCEMLPHEEVGLAAVDGVAQVLKVVEDYGIFEGFLCGARGQPALLVGQDEAHHVAARANS